MALLLPLAYLAHLCEEWWGGEGFVAWTQHALGAGVSPVRFLVLNGIAGPLFLAGTVAGIRSPRFAWCLVAFASLVVLNGLLHALATLAFASYSPGVVTGLLLYLPIGGLVLRDGLGRMPTETFRLAVMAGVAVHAVVAVVAFA